MKKYENGKGKFKVLDIEVFPNLFICVIKNTEQEKPIIIEKSVRKDNTYLLKKYLKDYIITYNGIDYDDIVNKFIVEHDPDTKTIKNFSDYVILNKDNDPDYYRKIKPYKYQEYKQIDLMKMLFSKKLRVSLKSLQIMLKWHNVLECDLPFDEDVPTNKIDEVIEYCINDVLFTEYLFNYSKKDIGFRFALNEEYDINTLSSDPVKIGVDLMTKFIGEKLVGKTLKYTDYGQHPIEIYGKTYDSVKIKDLKTGSDFVKKTRFIPKPFYLGEIINDFIKFDSPILKNLLEEIKNFKYYHKENYFEKRIIYKDTIYDIGSGGLHSYLPQPKIFTPRKDELYQQADYKSYYPSQRVFLKYEHEIWKNMFWEEDKDILYGRWEAQKNNNEVKNAAFKLLGNALFGQFGNEYSQFCSPKLGNAQTINGQLMILMMIEWLEESGINVIASNTDSVDIIYPEKYKDIVEQIGNKFCEVTKGIKVEYDNVAKSVYSDINCYFMQFTDGKIKEKGRWVTHYDHKGEWNPKMLNKGFKHPIVNIALKEFFINNKDIKETIYEHNDILDFCMSQKVGNSYTLWHNNNKLQKINRWYASTNGAYLYKEKNNSYEHLLKDKGVTIINYCKERNAKKYTDLDYNWYISQAQKQIDEIIPKQLKLF